VHLLDASQQGLSLTTPLLTLRKDSELGKQQLGRRHPVMEIFFTSSIKAKNFSSPDERLQLILEGKSSSRGTKLSYKAEVTPSQPKWSWLVEELQAVQLATDVKSLIQWLNHDILALAGPPWAEQNSLISSSEADGRPYHIAFVLCG